MTSHVKAVLVPDLHQLVGAAGSGLAAGQKHVVEPTIRRPRQKGNVGRRERRIRPLVVDLDGLRRGVTDARPIDGRQRSKIHLGVAATSVSRDTSG